MSKKKCVYEFRLERLPQNYSNETYLCRIIFFQFLVISINYSLEHGKSVRINKNPSEESFRKMLHFMRRSEQYKLIQVISVTTNDKQYSLP